MKYHKAILAAIMLLAAAVAVAMPERIIFPSHEDQTIAQQRDGSGVLLPCGKGWVSISAETGAVQYYECKPDEAAREFWRAVAATFPKVREGICAAAE